MTKQGYKSKIVGGVPFASSNYTTHQHILLVRKSLVGRAVEHTGLHGQKKCQPS